MRCVGKHATEHAKAGAPDYAALRTAMRAALEPKPLTPPTGDATKEAAPGEPSPAVPAAVPAASAPAATTIEPAKGTAP